MNRNNHRCGFGNLRRIGELSIPLLLLSTILAMHGQTGLTKEPGQNPDGVQVSGWISDMNGKPYFSGTSVIYLRNQSTANNGLPRTTTMHADGSFEFLHVAAGSYLVGVTGSSSYSPITALAVQKSDVRNIEIVVTRVLQVPGRLVMNGSGPLPILQFQLIDAESNPNRVTSAFTFPASPVNGNLLATVPLINARPGPDGTFFAAIPEGRWYLRLANELPPGYAIRNVAYGDSSVTPTSPMPVRSTDNSQFVVTLDSTEIKTFLVRGRINGLSEDSIARERVSIALRAATRSGQTIPARVARPLPDGTFAIDQVLPGVYSVLVGGTSVFQLATATLIVENSDVSDFEIEINLHEIRGHISVEGPSAVPSSVSILFQTNGQPLLTSAFPADMSNVQIRPSPDGSFRILLPDGTRRISTVTALPVGYSYKSVFYGTTDILNNPFSITKTDTAELSIILNFK